MHRLRQRAVHLNTNTTGLSQHVFEPILLLNSNQQSHLRQRKKCSRLKSSDKIDVPENQHYLPGDTCV